MKRQITFIVAGVGFAAGCCLMQGCSGPKANTGTTGTGFEIPLVEEPVQVETKQELPVLPPIATTTAYRVQKNDTISGVAARYGLRWQDVVAVNPGISPNKLQVGQTIQLPGHVDLSKTAAPRVTAPKAAAAPSRAETVYVVKSGDSVSEIAVKHGVKVADILKANELKDANKISVGQKLVIPGATKSNVTVAPAKKATAANTAAPVKKETKDPVAVPVPPPAAGKEAAADAAAVKTDLEQKADAAAAAPVAASKATHTVKAGEDVYTVAVRWAVSPSDLKALNKLTGPDLQEGQVLIIPPTANAQ